MSCHLKLGKTHATLSQTQCLASIGARETKASHSQWVVRSNSASHSQWVVRRVTKVKIIIQRMFKFIFPIKAEKK
ncbi:hypothetical protein [Leptospira noguchii]|uniref:Uncharacterized protein n=1 Tax=Leptospira noguchii TaxID=28182 RepID=A0AAE9KB40_9LEPT|nr:hypothetical protein [Leptospira noguchii]UOG32514.1 hypothetical protein MAL06_18795 [Leptospira noguchii]UOG54800.1 hypothetical protein MAL09_19460 [Leptospira noguchii]UOG58621.1 hypothetical protein MAL03_18320 [Leptospira noguchii]